MTASGVRAFSGSSDTATRFSLRFFGCLSITTNPLSNTAVNGRQAIIKIKQITHFAFTAFIIDSLCDNRYFVEHLHKLLLAEAIKLDGDHKIILGDNDAFAIMCVNGFFALRRILLFGLAWHIREQ